MPHHKDIFQALRMFFTPQSTEEHDRMHSARPFFLFVVLTISGLWGYSVYSYSGLRTAANILPFTGLIVLHILLHWFTPILIYRPRINLVYMLGQSILVFCIILFLKNAAVILVLYSILIIESISVIRERWQRLAGGLFPFVLLIVSIVQFSGWQSIISLILPFLLIIGIALPYVISYGQQDAARQQAQSLLHELEATHQKLADYALQVEELTRSQERVRIARELHDTLSQGLAGIILQLEAAISHLEEDNPDETYTILCHSVSDARQALSEARKTISTLRRSDAFTGDLRTQIQAEVNRFSNMSEIPYTLDISSVGQLSETVHQHILRILTEALSNIARHSHAKSAIITVRCTENHFTLTIQDDGIGFNTKVVPIGHYGLLGMKERARMIGAKLAIQSVPEKYTLIKLSIPFDKETVT
jgi:NarL family two-component system sensor histidine kinase YdfH